MRKYQNKILQKVVCNNCKKELHVVNGILQEGCFQGKQRFDYFSDKDGEIHEFDLCEQCYDSMIQKFQIPVSQKEETEFL
jgi:ribosomal-protein-alanine N-acetyltransferase